MKSAETPLHNGCLDVNCIKGIVNDFPLNKNPEEIFFGIMISLYPFIFRKFLWPVYLQTRN